MGLNLLRLRVLRSPVSYVLHKWSKQKTVMQQVERMATNSLPPTFRNELWLLDPEWIEAHKISKGMGVGVLSCHQVPMASYSELPLGGTQVSILSVWGKGVPNPLCLNHPPNKGCLILGLITTKLEARKGAIWMLPLTLISWFFWEGEVLSSSLPMHSFLHITVFFCQFPLAQTIS